MSQPTVIEVKAVNPRTPANPAVSKPTVPVRPVGALAMNLAAAAGEAVVAVGGGLALAAVAAGAVGVPLVVQTARGRIHAPAKKPRSPKTPRAGRPSGGGFGPRLRGLGKSPSGAGGRSAAPGRAAPTGRATPPGRPSAATPSKRGAAPNAGRKNAAPKTGRLAKAIRAARDRRANRPPSRRQIERMAWKAAGVNPPAGRLRTGARNLWSKRPWAKKPPAKPRPAVPVVASAKVPKKKVGNKVKGSVTAGPKPPVAAPAPNPAPLRPGAVPQLQLQPLVEGTPRPDLDPSQLTEHVSRPMVVAAAAAGGLTAGGTMAAASAMKALLEVVENDMQRIANNYDPTGIEEVLSEYGKWPEVLDALGKVWAIMVTKADEDYPLPPSASAVVDAIRVHQAAVARAAEEVPGLVRSILRERLDAMGDKRNAMLDHRANPNTAAI